MVCFDRSHQKSIAVSVLADEATDCAGASAGDETMASLRSELEAACSQVQALKQQSASDSKAATTKLQAAESAAEAAKGTTAGLQAELETMSAELADMQVISHFDAPEAVPGGQRPPTGPAQAVCLLACLLDRPKLHCHARQLTGIMLGPARLRASGEAGPGPVQRSHPTRAAHGAQPGFGSWKL